MVETEQRFCLRFFHINSMSNIFNFQLSISSDNSNSGSNNGGKALEKQLNDQMKNVVGPIFDILPIYFQRFACSCRDLQSL